MSAPVRLGTIGYGIMGERLLRVAREHDQSVVTSAGAWDPSPEAMARYKADFPDGMAFGSVEELMAASDVVHVASPPAYHLDQLEAAVAAGLAVHCEKPLGIDVAKAEALVGRMESVGARTAVNFPFTASFAHDQIQAWRDDGSLGTLERVEIEIGFAEWPRPWQMDAVAWLDRRAQGGYTREVVSHFLFGTLRRIGAIEMHSCSVEYPAGEGSEIACAAEMTAGGVPVTLSGKVGATKKADHNLWILHGSNGKVRLRDWAVAERLEADGVWREATGSRPNEEMRPLILKRQLDMVAAMTRGETDHSLASLREAFEVQRLVERILAS
ncbi:MAG: Gfo/Idh/MocA family protein [Alphaproteobacteria bacterium]